jgi:hypothetical protein
MNKLGWLLLSVVSLAGCVDSPFYADNRTIPNGSTVLSEEWTDDTVMTSATPVPKVTAKANKSAEEPKTEHKMPSAVEKVKAPKQPPIAAPVVNL